MMRIILLSMLAVIVSGCSWKAYDKEKAQEYHDYWQKEENRKGSIIYSLTNEYQEEHRPRK